MLEGVQWCWKGYSGVGRGTMVLEGVQWCWKGYNGVGKGLVGCSGGSGNGLGGGGVSQLSDTLHLPDYYHKCDSQHVSLEGRHC